MKNLKRIFNFHCAPFPCSILFYLPINSEWKLHGTEKCISQREMATDKGGKEGRQSKGNKQSECGCDCGWSEVTRERKKKRGRESGKERSAEARLGQREHERGVEQAIQNEQKSTRFISQIHTHTHANKTNSGYNLKAKTTKIIAKKRQKKIKTASDDDVCVI